MKNEFDILIVDDEQVVIDSVVKMGKIYNYKVDSADNPFVALTKIKENSYRLIICDIMLPSMNGFQFIDELQRQGIDIPIVMTTGYSTIDNAIQSIYKGAIDFVPKPFTFDELTATLKRAMKYSELINLKNKAQHKQIIYVSCPSKYFRFGYSCWVKDEFNGTILIGATNLYLKTIDNIRKIEMPSVGEKVNQAETFAKFEDDEGLIHNLHSALSGRIVEINEKLLTNVSILEKDPYFEGWICRLIPSEYENEKRLLIPCSSDR
ncbi:MAG: response regulator [Melioribacter sp.]|nr:response regulator [Melioribacter sp.]